MSYTNIKTLISHYEDFEQETGGEDLKQFGIWLNQKLDASDDQSSSKGGEEEQLNEDLMSALGELAQFSKHYIKKVIKDTPLSSQNDLVVMIVLYYRGGMRKSELVNDALLDMSSGIEVIKRLLKKGLVEEYVDLKDKRARQVALSKEGNGMFKKMFPELTKIGQIVGGNLSIQEKRTVAPILKKLVHFHRPVFTEDNDQSLDALIKKYLAR